MDHKTQGQVFLVKLLMFASLFYTVNTVPFNTVKLKLHGYVFVDIFKPASCVPPPVEVQKFCNLKYDILEFQGSSNLTQTLLKGVNVSVTSLDYIEDMTGKSDCILSVKEYGCFNVFAKCSSGSPGKAPMSMRYLVKNTTAACANVKKHCSPKIASLITHDCKDIRNDPAAFRKCKSIPKVSSDNVCKDFANYKYPLPSVDNFVTKSGIVKDAIKSLSNAWALDVDKNKECKKKFATMLCNLNNGPFCAGNENLRLFSISKQECDTIVKECLNYKIVLYQDICALFPDKTARQVPLPAGSKNKASGK